MATRTLEVQISDTPAQTRAVLEAYAAKADGEQATVNVERFVQMQRWLELAGERRVTVPFAQALAKAVPADQVRMRRDFPQLLTVIKASALLYQRQRERDADGRTVATFSDYEEACWLLEDVFTAAATGGVSQTVRETVEAVKALCANRNAVTAKAVGDKLGLAKSTTSDRITKAEDGGFLVNEETRKGRPKKLLPGDPLPEDRAALPSPAELVRLMEGTGYTDPKANRTPEPATPFTRNGDSEGVVRSSVRVPTEPQAEPLAKPPPDMESVESYASVRRFGLDPDDTVPCDRGHLLALVLSRGGELVDASEAV